MRGDYVEKKEGILQVIMMEGVLEREQCRKGRKRTGDSIKKEENYQVTTSKRKKANR